MARLAIRMPKMSMTMTEGEVSEWSAKVGDTIEVGDVVCEVMTDKVDMEVESTVAGRLVEIVVESGVAAVGDPIGWVEGEDDGGGFGDLLAAPAREPAKEPAPEAAPEVAGPRAGAAGEPDEALPASPADSEAAAPPAEPQSHGAAPDLGDDRPAVRVERQDAAPAPATTSTPPTGAAPVAAVPRARGLASERGVDLAAVTGTGPEGLVRVGDVEAFLAARSTPTPDRPAPDRPAQPAQSAQPAQPAQPAQAARPATGGRDRRAAVRAVVARTMTPSAAIPQFTVWREIALATADARRSGVSWTTVLLRAYAASLREVPDLLSRWEDERPTDAGPPAIALAVATDRGLLVPVFREPDRTPARELDEEIRAVVRSARTGKVDSAYLGVANGSLSNLGGQGVDRFQALLTPPQASVLSLGSIRQRPVAVPGGVGVALTVEAGLTVDHRVADGAHGADLLRRLAERLGDPE